MKNIRRFGRWLAIVSLAAAFSSCQDDPFIPEVEVDKPTVKTVSVSDITETSATVTGSVINNGGSTIIEAGIFVDGVKNVGTINGSIITVTVSGLFAGTGHIVKTYATNEAGIGYGSDLPFSTLGSLPTVETGEATGITSAAATLNAILKEASSTASISFEYGTTASYGSSIVAQAGETSASGQAFSANLTGLNANTKYYFRVRIDQDGRQGYGAGKEFSTLAKWTIDGVAIRDVTSDVEGNVYVSGEIGEGIFDGKHSFLARFNADGTLVWRQNITTDYIHEVTYRATKVVNGVLYSQISHRNPSSAPSSEVFVYAYSAATGELKWKTSIGEGTSRSMDVDGEGNVYSVCFQLVKINPQGEIVFRKPDLDGYSFYCVDVSDYVYVGGRRHNYDTGTGYSWRFDKEANLLASMEGNTGRNVYIRNILSVPSKALFTMETHIEDTAADSKNVLVCYTSGKTWWQKEISGTDNLLERNGDRVFIFSFGPSAQITEIDIVNGEVLWTSAQSTSGDIAIVGDKIFVANNASSLSILNR